MPRHLALYGYAIGRSTDAQRHIIRAVGPNGFPRGLCEAGIVLRDDPMLPLHRECVLIATTELALAAENLGLHEAAVLIAREASDLSYETAAAMSDEAPGQMGWDPT